MSKENFRFQAHRGDSAFYPENTLVSYDAAVKEGYQVIEMDSKFTRDNVCIMLHDGSVNRTCRSSFTHTSPAAYTPSRFVRCEPSVTI